MSLLAVNTKSTTICLKLQFLASEPYLSALLWHENMLVDVGKPSSLEGFSNAKTENIIVLVFPWNHKRSDCFCLDPWENSKKYPFITLRLGAAPTNVEPFGKVLAQSCTPVNGYQGAAFICFDPRQGELLEQRLSNKARSWEDIRAILYHYFYAGVEALNNINLQKAAHIYLKRAIHMLRVANVVFNHFAHTTPIYSPSMINHSGTRRLQHIGKDITLATSAAYSLCVDSERDFDDDNMSRRSSSLIGNALKAVNTRNARRPNEQQMITAYYQCGLAQQNKAEYERTYPNALNECQACYRQWEFTLKRAAVDYYAACIIAKELIEEIGEEEGEGEGEEGGVSQLLDLAETTLFLAKDDLGWTRRKTIRHGERLGVLGRQQSPDEEDSDSEDEAIHQHSYSEGVGD